jgi:uncharacterized cupin superfamily protein
VSPGQLNVAHCELSVELDEHGFRHRVEPLGARLGAQRIGAAVYAAAADVPIWPYHYHHGIEEWLYVISGSPVLRDAGGRRALTAGDLVCFPSGHLGAHTIDGPGRFMLLSCGGRPEPSISAYPDSDKVGVVSGRSAINRLNVIMVPRDAGVGYWHREGTAGATEPEAEIVREPGSAASPPVINALTVAAERQSADAPAGVRSRVASVGGPLGAERLGATILELDPGEGSGPYHYQCGREEWLLVLTGTPTLRRPEAEARLEPMDLVCFPDGPAGAHRVINRGEGGARVLLLSTRGIPANVCFPDSGHWLMRNGHGASTLTFHESDAVGCGDGEA